jgi:alanine racemase
MDQVVLDVTQVPCRVGDEVVLLGKQQKAEITAWDLAKEAKTIPWEIYTNISSRVKRVYNHFDTLAANI